MSYKVIIDADVIVYKIGFALEGTNSGRLVKSSVEDYIKTVMDHVEKIFTKVSSPIIVISGESKDNFRFGIATIKPYKGNRTSPKPKHYDLIRQILRSMPGALVSKNEEADDLVADLAKANPLKTLIVSADKDLRQVPGWHFEPGDKRPIYYVDPTSIGVIMLERATGNKPGLFATGKVWHLAQMLLGDAADNIPGISGYGVVKVYSKFTKIINAENVKSVLESMESLVHSEYEKEYGEDYMEKVKEVYTLLKMGGHENG